MMDDRRTFFLFLVALVSHLAKKAGHMCDNLSDI